MCILLEQWKSSPVRPDEFLPRQGDYWLGLLLRRIAAFAVPLETMRQVRKPFLKFTSKNMLHSVGAEMRFIHGRIKTIEAQVCAGIHAANRFDKLNGQPSSRVHGHVESDKFGTANHILVQRLPGKIKDGDSMTSLPQPGRRRRQPEGLPA